MITVVVPVYNEKENIKPLNSQILDATKDLPVTEVIYVDDSSTDGSWDVLKELRRLHPVLRIVRHQKNFGQSAALWTGIKAAGNELIVTLDGDGQNPPEDIKVLWDAYKRNSKDSPGLMVAGERIRRNDNWVRRLSSRVANGIRSGLLQDQTRDTGCSLKLFRRSDYLNLPYFDHMHRFLPALMLRDGVKLIHAPVSHRPRVHGQSKYGTLDRALVGITDLLGVLWLQKRARRPRDNESHEALTQETP